MLECYWTPKHYLPVFFGSLIGGMYANVYLHFVAPFLAWKFHVILPSWTLTLTAQVAFWLSVWLAQRALFPRRRPAMAKTKPGEGGGSSKKRLPKPAKITKGGSAGNSYPGVHQQTHSS